MSCWLLEKEGLWATSISSSPEFSPELPRLQKTEARSVAVGCVTVLLLQLSAPSAAAGEVLHLLRGRQSTEMLNKGISYKVLLSAHAQPLNSEPEGTLSSQRLFWGLAS